MIEVAPHLEKLMKERYYQEDESDITDVIARVASFVAYGEEKYGASEAECEKWYRKYYDGMLQRKWIPSSPFLMNAGTSVNMLSACFVIGELEDNMDSIYEMLKRQGMVNKSGGGTGFDFGKLREEGSPIGSTGGVSSGVMSFMELFNENGEVIKQGGKRRYS